MITAEEARKMVETITFERNKREREQVEEIIMETIVAEQYGCKLGIYVSTSTKEWLESLGYDVRWLHCSGDNSVSDTVVKW